MSYDSIDSSVQDGNPIELYDFVCGFDHWRYTSSANTINKGGYDYSPESIRRTNISQSDDITKGSVKITFPLSNSFARSFLNYAPDNLTLLTILRKHLTDSADEYATYWKGRVLKASASGAEVTISCESIFSSLKRQGLRPRFQRTCRHGLYDTHCRVNMASFRLDAVVTSADGRNLVIGDAASQPNGYYTGGVIRNSDGVWRLIANHVGTAITLSRGFKISPGGTTVSLYPGCDKLKDTCINKFSNLANFGGFPHIPTINPFSGRSII